MSYYTTGEMAKLCDISVRTVQFYDTKDILKPTELSEGGRRLYCEDDLIAMKKICVMKSLGLTLDSIKEILQSDDENKVLLLLLSEREKAISSELSQRQKQLSTIKLIKENIENSSPLPVNSMSDIENIMTNRKNLTKTHMTILIAAILVDIAQIGMLLIWIFKGNFIPFVALIPFVILSCVLMTGYYYKHTSYICPECNTEFRPKLREFIFARHTPKTRKLTCTACNKKSMCVEVYNKKN